MRCEEEPLMRRPVYPLHLLSSQHRFSGHGSLPTWGASWKCQATGIRSAQATVVSALEWRCSEVWSRASWLKLQYFGYLMQRADSLEKTLMLGKIEGRRWGRQRMRWLDGITDSMDMSLSPSSPGTT